MSVRLLGRIIALRLTVMGNGFRRPYPAAVRSVAGLLLLGLVAVCAAATARLDPIALHSVSVVGGTVLVGVCAFLPAAIAREDPLHPRGFAGTGARFVPVVVALLITDVVSFRAVLLAVVIGGWVAGWTAVGVGGIALLLAIQLVIVLLQLVRLSSAVGGRLWRRSGRVPGRAVAWALLVVSAIPAGVAVVAGLDSGRTGAVVDALERAGLGVLWSPISAGSAPLLPFAPLALIVVLAVVEVLVVRAQWRGGRPHSSPHAPHLGPFAIVPGSPAAAIAARSAVYWARDPRYAGSVVAIPFVPVLMLIAAAIGGVPGVVMALVTVPAVVLLIGWSLTHNDTAYDSTAIWTHVVAPIRGTQDRVGRIVPPLVLGLIVSGLGILLVLLLVPVPGVAAVVGGLCAVALLGSLGVSSAVSARFPYATPTPGSSAFQSPQSPGSGGAVQTVSVLAALILMAPAIWAAVRWLSDGGAWSWIALALGVGVGFAALVVGVLIGGASFERRGPDLIDFAVRN